MLTLKEKNAVKLKKETSSIYLFWGPEGAGKTLSTFKYAEHKEGRKGERLFLSNDTYHIGAEKQFQVFSDISGFDYLHFQTESIERHFDKISRYNTVYFDCLRRENHPSFENLMFFLKQRFSVKKILVLNMFMLFDENILKYYLNEKEAPDEFIITFVDYFSYLSQDNKIIIKKRINGLADSSTLWIANGPSVPADFCKYTGNDLLL